MTAQRTRDIEALIKLWEVGMPSIPPPPASQFELWFSIHAGDFGTLAYGLQECARLYVQRRGIMDQDHCIKHSSRVMNGYSRARRKNASEHFPLNILTKNLADAVGQPGLAGVALTEGMYWRIQRRALAIRQGRIPAPSPSTAVTDKNVSETKKAA